MIESVRKHNEERANQLCAEIERLTGIRTGQVRHNAAANLITLTLPDADVVVERLKEA